MSKSNNIVNDFLTKKKVDKRDLSLGKLAISQSKYFDLGGQNIKRVGFSKSLSGQQLNTGYREIIGLIEGDLGAIDSINEAVLHSKFVTNLSHLINNTLIRSSATKLSTSITIIGSLIYATYTLLRTSLYPSPVVIMTIWILSWVISNIATIFSNKK